MRNRATIAAALSALALGLAACGEKDEPETTGPLEPVESTASTTAETTVNPTGEALAADDVVDAFLTSPDVELVCDELITERFMRASYGDRTGCVEGREPASLASTVEFGPGGAADVVTATPEGGVYDGDELTFTLVRAGDSFAIDSVDSNAPVGP